MEGIKRERGTEVGGGGETLLRQNKGKDRKTKRRAWQRLESLWKSELSWNDLAIQMLLLTCSGR